MPFIRYLFYCVFVISRQRGLVRVYQNDIDIASKIDLTKPIAFVIHGWMDRFFSDLAVDNAQGWPLSTIVLWSHFVDTNACGVDWGDLSGANYIASALKNTHITAYWVTKLMLYINKNGISFDNMTIAGHSLGGQVAGFVGKKVQHFTGETLGTIYGKFAMLVFFVVFFVLSV